MKTKKIYRNKNFKRKSKTTMFLVDHLSWIERNRPEGMARDGFIQHLIALGIKTYIANSLNTRGYFEGGDPLKEGDNLLIGGEKHVIGVSKP